jgi:hypothetical protein
MTGSDQQSESPAADEIKHSLADELILHPLYRFDFKKKNPIPTSEFKPSLSPTSLDFKKTLARDTVLWLTISL